MTEAPGQAAPSAMNKTIQSCGSPSMHETGTTFFTDGTSGWTQNCADAMMAQYSPAPVSPTFDPNSADGYGPNQPLPPFCVRFPNEPQCNGEDQ